jgi:hypothetical protein
MMYLRTLSALFRVSLSSSPIGEITKQGFFCDGSTGFVAAGAAAAACGGLAFATGHLGTPEFAERWSITDGLCTAVCKLPGATAFDF